MQNRHKHHGLELGTGQRRSGQHTKHQQTCRGQHHRSARDSFADHHISAGDHSVTPNAPELGVGSDGQNKHRTPNKPEFERVVEKCFTAARMTCWQNHHIKSSQCRRSLNHAKHQLKTGFKRAQTSVTATPMTSWHTYPAEHKTQTARLSVQEITPHHRPMPASILNFRHHTIFRLLQTLRVDRTWRALLHTSPATAYFSPHHSKCFPWAARQALPLIFRVCVQQQYGLRFSVFLFVFHPPPPLRSARNMSGV